MGNRSERGAALILALIATMVLTALGIGLVLNMMVEGTIASAFSSAQTNFYAGESGLAWSIDQLSSGPDWDAALSSAPPAYFAGAGSNLAGVDVPTATRALQQTSDLRYGSGVNRPVWRVLGHGPLANLTATTGAIPYLIIWVADDPAEHDGAPGRDSNGRIMLHVEAYGSRESRRVLEATLSRDSASGPGSPAIVRVLDWRERRDGI